MQANALFTLVVIYNREGRYDDALRAIDELQRRFPRNRLLWLEAGTTLLRAGRCAAARDALEQGLRKLATDRRPRAFGEEARWRSAYGAALAGLGRAEQNVLDDSHARRPAGDRHGCAPGVAIDHRACDRLHRRLLDGDLRRRHARVVEMVADDPRPDLVRRQALFDFMYQTYEASAWIPQSLFDRNLVTQVVVGSVETIVREKVGLVLWRDNPLVPAFGMAPKGANSPSAGRWERLRWTVNCLVCHTAEIDGVAYFGAGTKVFDDNWLGEALKSADERSLATAAARLSATRLWRPRRTGSSQPPSRQDRLAHARALDGVCRITRRAVHARTTARMPRVDDVGRGDVKTPPLWHTAAKMPPGRWYTDGSFHGRFPLMASSMELEKDRSFDALVETVVPAIKEEFDSVIRHLRPPRTLTRSIAISPAGSRAVLIACDRLLTLPRGVRRPRECELARRHMSTSAPTPRASRSCLAGSSTRSTKARWLPRAHSAGATVTPPRR